MRHILAVVLVLCVTALVAGCDEEEVTVVPTCIDEDCPLACECSDQSFMCVRSDNPDVECSGCNRTTCGEGSTCQFERPGAQGVDIFACMPDDGPGDPEPSNTPRVGVDFENGVLKRISRDGIVDIGPLFSPELREIPEIRQLAYDWDSGTLYGVNTGLRLDHRLYRIDLCTGEATSLGRLLRPDSEPFVLLEGIAVRSVDDAGQIYVSGSVEDEIVFSATLLTVAISDAPATEVTTTVVGDFGTTRDGGPGIGDADRIFFRGDNLYLTDSSPREGGEGPPFDTWTYSVDLSEEAERLLTVPRGRAQAEINSVAHDPNENVTEFVDWSTQGWSQLDVEFGSVQPIEGVPGFDGPFAFVDEAVLAACPAPSP